MPTNYERTFEARPTSARPSASSSPRLEIMDVVLTAAVRSFWTKTLDALGVRPDASYRELEPQLREVLVVGRPIAES